MSGQLGKLPMPNDLNLIYAAYIANPTPETEEVFVQEMLNLGVAWTKKVYRGNCERYEDIVVDLVIKIWQNVGEYQQFQEKQSFKTWFLMQLKGDLINAFTATKQERPLSPNLTAPSDHWREAKIDLERFIPTLTAKQQEVLDLTLEGYTHEEIAAKWDISQQAVQQVYNRAVESLKRKMNPDK